MKQVILGTVSALALTLAVAGGAYAGPTSTNETAIAVSDASNLVLFNFAIGGLVIGDNEIDRDAFEHAKGAFNVGQNQSINSSVQQSMAIAAVINSPSSDDTTKSGSNELGLAASGGTSIVAANFALFDAVLGANEIENDAFKDAKGAFQVLQNRSINSGVSQSMAIGAVVSKDRDNDANPFGNQTALAASDLDSAVVGNVAALAVVGRLGNTNLITDHAFQHAAGAFNVLQNASINSSVQQSMSIGAVVNRAN
jgi:hypothetical protein